MLFEIGLLYLYRNIAFGNFPHVEAYSWNHVFIKLTRLKRDMSIVMDTQLKGAENPCKYKVNIYYLLYSV